MKPSLLIAIIFTIGVTSCTQRKQEPMIGPTAVELYDSSKLFENNNRGIALDLLNKATALDSDYYQAYFDKLPMLLGFKDYSNALLATAEMMRLKPLDPGINLTRGFLYERLGDTASSRKSFKKAITLYDVVMDTIPRQNDRYSELLTDKALCLILVGEEELGKIILEKVYNSGVDDRLRTSVKLVMNKSREEILESRF